MKKGKFKISVWIGFIRTCQTFLDGSEDSTRILFALLRCMRIFTKRDYNVELKGRVITRIKIFCTKNSGYVFDKVDIKEWSKKNPVEFRPYVANLDL